MPVIVTHSTEGSSLTAAINTLRSGNKESHDVVDIRARKVEHLLPYTQPARSLKNLDGGVQTNNRGGVIQVEFVGFASRSSLEQAGAAKNSVVIPELQNDDLLFVAHYLRWVCAVTGTPYVFPRQFIPYPLSYGDKAHNRLSPQEWLAVEGIIGHQHVPENVHGDPGALNTLHLAELGLSIPVQEGPDMTPDELKIIQVAHDGTSSNLIDVFGWLLEGVNKLNARIDVLEQRPVTGAADVDEAAVAAAVVDAIVKDLAD